MKKPKLSEIRKARQGYGGSTNSGYEFDYLLDLVKRLGERIKTDSPYLSRGCNCPRCKEARALLEELEL